MAPIEQPEYRHALLVEDEILVALDIEEQLTSLGFAVIGPAARVADGLRLADEARGLAVAVLDVNLAGEASWPIARLLKDRGTPFLFLTGYHFGHAGLPADLAGAVICSKPVDIVALRAAIAATVAARQPIAGGRD